MYVIAMMLNNQQVEYVLCSDTGKHAMKWKYECIVLKFDSLTFNTVWQWIIVHIIQRYLYLNHRLNNNKRNTCNNKSMIWTQRNQLNRFPWAELENHGIDYKQTYCIEKIFFEQITNVSTFP